MMLLWPLVATIVIELLVLRFLGESQRRVLWASVGMNILTNVPLNLAALYVADIWNVLVIGELLVVFIAMIISLTMQKRLGIDLNRM